MNTDKPEDSPREIGRYTRGQGPLVLCFGGMHGNETGGIAALGNVLETLHEQDLPIRGGLVALAGNRRALSQGVRYVDEDLNRIWTTDRLRNLGDSLTPSSEEQEQIEILDTLQSTLLAVDHPVYVIDLHTTSGPGTPFGLVLDSLRNRFFARKFPLPIILGMEEHMVGAMIYHLDAYGPVNMAVEGGQHNDPSTINHLEAIIWIALTAAGCLDSDATPEMDEHRSRLVEATGSLPDFVEVRYRHAILGGDGFAMEPGWENFRKVSKGQLLGRDRHGEILAPRNGRVLFPLYQKQGEDGFFIVQDVHPLWIKLSSVLRKLRLSALLPWLPGFHVHPENEEVVRVSPWMARLPILGLMHLLGYRKTPEDDSKDVVFVRRKNDLVLPHRLTGC